MFKLKVTVAQLGSFRCVYRGSKEGFGRDGRGTSMCQGVPPWSSYGMHLWSCLDVKVLEVQTAFLVFPVVIFFPSARVAGSPG